MQVDASDPRPGKEEGTKKTLGGAEPSRGHPDSSEQESCSLPTRQLRGLNVIRRLLRSVVTKSSNACMFKVCSLAVTFELMMAFLDSERESSYSPLICHRNAAGSLNV